MRKLVVFAVLGVAMLLSAAVADAADRTAQRIVSARATSGNVPPSMLAEMGLEGMEVLSDQKGTEVRGNGFFFFFVGFHHHFHPFFFHPFFFHHHHHHHLGGHFDHPHRW